MKGETVADTRPSGAATTPSTARERIERHALANEIMRVRAVLFVAWAIWVVGAGFDIVTYEVLGGGPLWLIEVTRLSSLAFHGIVALRLFRGGLDTPRLTRGLIVATFPVSALAQSILAVALGGITSPYIGGVYVVLICQGAAVLMPWRRGFVLTTITTWMFPLGVAIGYAASPAVRAQLAAPYAQHLFVLETMVLFSAGFVTVWASHGLWLLRQRLVESASVGRYRLLRRIGRGGMGEVWHAHDRATRRDVALKILVQRVDAADTREMRALIDRFEREIATTARLEHPNVVRIVDWGATDDGIWYYAMELLDGCDLASLVADSGPLSPRAVVHVGLQAARALAAAHAAGIVHRDVKPANLFVLDRYGALEIKILDFGIARIEGDDNLTRTGALIGTPAYMAPETTAGGTATTASDVWSLAATLRFAATGKLPHEDAALELPEDVAAILAAAMTREPAGRPVDGQALAAALAACSLATGSPVPAPHLVRTRAAAVDPQAPTLAPSSPR